eukprot:1141835-Pelagomonas_calceolata.AAC.2
MDWQIASYVSATWAAQQYTALLKDTEDANDVLVEDSAVWGICIGFYTRLSEMIVVFALTPFSLEPRI